MSNYNSDTFCPLPFIHVCTQRNGDFMPCGQSRQYTGHNAYGDTVETAWNSEFYKQLRLDLINGVRNKNCDFCWQYDDKKQLSRRTRNLAWHEAREQVIKLVDEARQNNGAISSLPEEMLIKLDNTCNLKCPTCNQYQSSLHETEVNKMREQKIELTSWQLFVEREWQDRGRDSSQPFPKTIMDSVNNLKEISIEGGEPFVNKQMLDLLDHCIDNDLKDIKIVTTSNLTSLTKRVIDKLAQLNNVHLWISWDTLDSERFRFIRYPADYNHFQKNLKRLIATGIHINFSYTLSVFNALDVVTTLTELERYSVEEIVFKPVLAPNYFSPRYLDLKTKAILIKSLCEYKTTNSVLQRSLAETIYLLEQDENDCDAIVQERTRILTVYDQLRNTDYKKLFPYL